jgi:hypothetical protein
VAIEAIQERRSNRRAPTIGTRELDDTDGEGEDRSKVDTEGDDRTVEATAD